MARPTSPLILTVSGSGNPRRGGPKVSPYSSEAATSFVGSSSSGGLPSSTAGRAPSSLQHTKSFSMKKHDALYAVDFPGRPRASSLTEDTSDKLQPIVSEDSKAHRAAIMLKYRPKLDLRHRRRDKFTRTCGCAAFNPLYGTLVHDNILVGNREGAACLDMLLYYGVTHILNASLNIPNFFPDDFVYCNIRIEDSDKEDISAEFHRAVPFIHDAVRAKSRVFVHCVAGVSRSVSLVAAYLIIQPRERLDDVLRLIRRRRSIAEPNHGFLLALAEVEVEMQGCSSVARSKDKLWAFGAWQRRADKVPVAPTRPTRCLPHTCCVM